jgi:HlyD family secretion protein
MAVSNAQPPWQGRRVWIGIIALLLLGTGFFTFRLLTTPVNPPDPSGETAAPPQQVTVAALGRLEPDGEVIKVSGPQGDRMIILKVAEGDYVPRGTILGYLENFEEQLAQRNYALSQFLEARSQFQAEAQYGAMKIREARTRVGQSDQPRSFEITAQQATVRQLEAELQLAQIDLQRNQLLQQEGAISRRELDQQVTQVRQQQELLNNAKANLIRLQAARTTDLSNAEAQVQSAQADMTRSQAETEVESTARNLQLAEAKLNRSIIRAPESGEILKIHTRAGEAIGDDGILDMGNTRQMNVVAEVYETDVSRVRLGQTATITSRNGAFDQTLTGRVIRIGSQIFKNNVLDDDPAANADARVVEVRIRLDQSQVVRQLTNLQVDVRVDVEASGSPAIAPVAPSPTTTP